MHPGRPAIGRTGPGTAVIIAQRKRHPHLAGTDLIDASGHPHPGLLNTLRLKALKDGIDVVGFPSQGQQTNNYAEFGARVRQVPTEQLSYVGVGLYGRRKAVGRIVGRYPLLK